MGKRRMQFVIRERGGSGGKYYFELRGTNHKVAAISQDYKTRAACRRTIRRIIAGVPDALITESP